VEALKSKLQILLVEDSLSDAELIARELDMAGFSFAIARVETEVEFRRHLNAGPNLILSDHGLPSFNGFRALEIVRKVRPQLPFIFVSGSNDQQMIIEMYDLGATDYVFKRDIGDLRWAVKNALEPAPVVEPPAKPVMPRAGSPSLAPEGHSVIDQITFCPQCHRAWDEVGNSILIEDYCGHHVKTMVYCHVCRNCVGRAHLLKTP
jgi:DNA-binding response OmpR family regulator